MYVHQMFSWQILKVAFIFLPSGLWLEVVSQQTRRQILKVAFIFPHSVLWLEVASQQTRRVTVLGCQDGHVKVAVTELSGGPSMFNLFKFLLEPLRCWLSMV